MAIERLYLIRVGMERFLGPFSFRQVQDAYRKMQFGLQDEICGSLRSWVSFDNLEAVRRHYPELVQFVEGEMLSGWNGGSVSDQSTLPSQINGGGSRNGNFSLFVLCILLAIGAGVAFLSYHDGEWVNPLGMLKDRTLYQARSLYGDRYNPRFEGFMDRNRGEINQAMRKKKGYAQWLPYVRSVAFGKDGRWEGLTAKKLRGSAENSMPQDCSIAAWDDRWKRSQGDWSGFLEGRELPREEWASLLIMDSHWVRNRSPMAGWIDPGSYYEGCLRTAMKSLARVGNDGDAKILLSRLRWQLGVISRNSPSEEFEMSGTLWAVSCLEDVHDAGEIRSCFSSIKMRRPWQVFFDSSVILRKMAILVGNKSQLNDSEVRALNELMESRSGNGSELPVSYDEEMRFYQEIIQQKGNVRAARSVLQKRYPSIQFEP